ncbi:MAG: family 43 glycosylhydrolase [Clostridiales bacterium]|nr:family 43 glycosylhydrolase [Clostridiales bacterium]
MELEETAYYTNSIKDDIGDPFVMRWNGRYYLYPSSGTEKIECWTSTDLVNWEYGGVCAENPVLRNAYAPEVVYYNGNFYMYTSPDGQGHYVLQSESPTGPFQVITGNMRRDIDGDVFIDDDGQWYFLTSGGTCITRYPMTSPSDFGDGTPLRAASMAGSWTEGPMVVKHDGLYYLTYTGNHVLHKGYRVGYAVGDSMDTLSKATDTLLVSTTDEVFGPGHSSSVKGPDLDSYYIAYHTLIEVNGGSPSRNMSIDRLVFNGEVMEALGPTVTQQQMPAQPDICSYFDSAAALAGWTGGQLENGALALSDGDLVVSDQTYTGDFTAEFCVSGITGRRGRAGAIFAYRDDKNYAAALLNAQEQTLDVSVVKDGQAKELANLPLTTSFQEPVRLDCVQSMQIERTDDSYEFFFNDHTVGSVTIPDADGADAAYKVGLYAENTSASCSYLGLTGEVHGGSADTYYKPVPGSIQARNCLEDFSADALEPVKVQNDSLHSYALRTKAGQSYSYRVNVKSDGYYDLAILYRSAALAEFSVSVDGETMRTGSMQPSQEYATTALRRVPLTKGEHTIALTYASGEPTVVRYSLTAHTAVEPIAQTYDAEEDNASYYGGPWTVRDGVLAMPEASCGKRLYGADGWSDYTVEADITPIGGTNSGLLVRATNPDSGNYVGTPDSAPSNTGTDWLQGYFVGPGLLGKQDYGWTTLAQDDRVSVSAGETYHMKVVCEGPNIKVYINGTLSIDYTDPEPFLNGKVGMRTHYCATQYDNFTVTPIHTAVKAELQQLIDTVDAADLTGADPVKLETLNQKLDAARQVMERDTVTEAEIDTAYTALQAAFDALIKAEVIPGDLDGDGTVTIQDVMEACKILARQSAGKAPTADELAAGDLDGDEKISINDVMEICKILARQA